MKTASKYLPGSYGAHTNRLLWVTESALHCYAVLGAFEPRLSGLLSKSVTTRPRIQSAKGILKFVFLVTCESYRKTWMAVKTGYRNRRMAVKQVTKARNMKRFYFYFWLLSSFFLFFFPENILQPIRPPVKLTDCWTFFHQKTFLHFVIPFKTRSFIYTDVGKWLTHVQNRQCHYFTGDQTSVGDETMEWVFKFS